MSSQVFDPPFAASLDHQESRNLSPGPPVVNDQTSSSSSASATIEATSARKIRLPGAPICHIGPSDAFIRQRCSSMVAAAIGAKMTAPSILLSGLRASLISVLIGIKPSSR